MSAQIRGHLTGTADMLVRPGAWMARAGDWAAHLGATTGDAAIAAIRANSGTGPPLGAQDFVTGLERTLGRALGRRKPGPKARAADADVGLLRLL